MFILAVTAAQVPVSVFTAQYINVIKNNKFNLSS